MSYRFDVETDEVEAREPGRPRRGRSHPISAVIAVLILLAAITAVLWVGYHVMSRRAGGEVPLIRADPRPIKVAPAQPGGMEVPDQDIYILNRQKPLDSRVEQLLPAPEAPLPRPTPPEPALVDTPAPDEAPAPVIQPPSPPVSAQPASAAPTPPAQAVAPAAALPPPAPTAAPLPESVPPPTPPAPARTASLPPAETGSGYRLQLGSVRSVEEAQREWDRLKRVEPELLGKFKADAVRADLGERGVFYRIEAGRFANAAEGDRLCAELKRHDIGCILVKP